MKLACERHENYISAARMILNLCRPKKQGDASFENLWHILDLMAYEITALANMVENQIEEILTESFDEEGMILPANSRG